MGRGSLSISYVTSSSYVGLSHWDRGLPARLIELAVAISGLEARGPSDHTNRVTPALTVETAPHLE